MSITAVRRNQNHLKCLQAYELREKEGMTYAAIARAVNIDSDTVRRWIVDPTHFDPYYDEVALKRALEGERKVYDALSYWEFYELYRRIARLKRSMSHQEWREFVGDYCAKVDLSLGNFWTAVTEAANELD